MNMPFEFTDTKLGAANRVREDLSEVVAGNVGVSDGQPMDN